MVQFGQLGVSGDIGRGAGGGGRPLMLSEGLEELSRAQPPAASGQGRVSPACRDKDCFLAHMSGCSIFSNTKISGFRC